LQIFLYVLTPNTIGEQSYSGTAALNKAETIFIAPDFVEINKPDVDIEPEPFKEPKPFYADDNDDCGDDGKRYCVYICKRNYKCKGNVNSVSHPLKYVGITSAPPELVTNGGRYSQGEIQATDLTVVFRDLTKCEARGIEQLIIELNNNDAPFPYTSTKIDNFQNSTSPLRLKVFVLRKQAGQNAIDRSRYKSRWKQFFGGNNTYNTGGFQFRGNEYGNESCRF
jgi:hypothetical protein